MCSVVHWHCFWCVIFLLVIGAQADTTQLTFARQVSFHPFLSLSNTILFIYIFDFNKKHNFYGHHALNSFHKMPSHNVGQSDEVAKIGKTTLMKAV